jgi:hypothetical protein
MSDYLTVSVNPPPLDVKIIVKKETGKFTFDDGAKIMTLDSNLDSIDGYVMALVVDKLTLWRLV